MKLKRPDFPSYNGGSDGESEKLEAQERLVDARLDAIKFINKYKDKQ